MSNKAGGAKRHPHQRMRELVASLLQRRFPELSGDGRVKIAVRVDRFPPELAVMIDPKLWEDEQTTITQFFDTIELSIQVPGLQLAGRLKDGFVEDVGPHAGSRVRIWRLEGVEIH